MPHATPAADMAALDRVEERLANRNQAPGRFVHLARSRETPLRQLVMNCRRIRTRAGRHGSCWPQGIMLDLVVVLGTLAFFGIGWAYARSCDRL